MTIQAQEIPSAHGYVNDFANVIDPASKQKLETILSNFQRQTGIEIAVVTVTEAMVAGRPWESYTINLARSWGIGGTNNEPAALIVVKPDGGEGQRRTRTEISRHLEGDIPDALAGREINERMRPYFRAGQIGQGLLVGVQTLTATIAEKRGLSIEGIDQRYAYQARPPRQKSGGIPLGLIVIGVVVFFFILSRLGGRNRGGPRGGGGGGSGLLEAVLWSHILLGGSRHGGSSSSGWGGGGSDWGGGGGSDWGGFGGGGDFGGGGASDSW